MEEKPSYISDECWGVIKQLMLAIINVPLRSLHTEVTVLTAIVEAIKGARPELRPAIDQMAQMAYGSEDTRRSVERKLEPTLKVVNSFDQSSRDRALEEIMRLYSRPAS